MDKLLKLLRAEPRKQAILIQAFVIQLGVRIALVALPFYVILSILQRIEMAAKRSPHHNRVRTGKYSVEGPSVLQTLPWAVRATSPFVPGSRCLCQAITAQMLFALKGLTTELRIGVQKSYSSELTAHAWLVRQGQILMGNLPNISDFMPLPTLPRVIR